MDVKPNVDLATLQSNLPTVSLQKSSREIGPAIQSPTDTIINKTENHECHLGQPLSSMQVSEAVVGELKDKPKVGLSGEVLAPQINRDLETLQSHKHLAILKPSPPLRPTTPNMEDSSRFGMIFDHRGCVHVCQGGSLSGQNCHWKYEDQKHEMLADWLARTHHE
jgi:hypothetical protein